jgi:hypothetical protein
MSRPLRAAIACALCISCISCSPKTVWHADARTLCHGRVCYEVGPLGSGWRTVHKEAAQIGFFNDATGAVIQSNATCRDDAEAAPLDALTRQLLIGYTERHILESHTVPLAGREALRTRVAAKLDGVPIMLELYVLKRNGCVFDLSYVAPPDSYARSERDFARFVSGFADARGS